MHAVKVPRRNEYPSNAQAALRFMNRKPVDLEEVSEILQDIVKDNSRAGDDNPSVRKALARLLKSAGYSAQASASARDFLDHAVDDGSACLVLDIRMPGLTGIDLQRELNTAKTILPIIFITGHGDVPTSCAR
jgi:response regulator RpfG family c-di-GMP phosphodiesterase